MEKKVLYSFITSLLLLTHFLNAERGPDFFIIGAMKSGTTALYHYVQQHPLIVKKEGETHFFDLNYEKGENWYLQQFPKRPKNNYLIGDKSPYYLLHPLAAERLYRFNPSAKIIILLRNPIDRAYSHYQQCIRSQREKLTFSEAIVKERERLKGEKQKIISQQSYNSYNYQFFSYLSRGLYARQIEKWFSIFPREQILILDMKELLIDRDGLLAKVFSFLEVPFFSPTNPYVAPPHPYPPMDPDVRSHLIEYFKKPNQQLQELLQMEFSWDR